MRGTKAKLLTMTMTTSKQGDDIGYCLQITPAGINVAKIFRHDPRINSQDAIRLFIKCLVDASPKKTLDDFNLDACCCQFSDRNIDIFCDDESMLKDLPLVATTGSGVPLHGNLCIVGSDEVGNSVLLTESQITTVLQELDFPEHPYVNQIDLTDLNPFTNATQEEAIALRKLLELLINHCVNNEVQLITRAKAILKDTDNSVLVVCLHGDDDAIKNLHLDIQELIKTCEIGKDET